MRIKLTDNEIYKAVQQRIDAIDSIREDYATVTISKPYWHEFDSDGCNWNIASVRNGTAYLDLVQAVIKAARQQYELVE